jgi:flagellar assembly protein FliH
MKTQPLVLRNVAVSEQPYALGRPSGHPAHPGLPVPMAAGGLPDTDSAPVAPPQPESLVADIESVQEEAFRRGCELGREEGLREAFDAARMEALAAARDQGLLEGREAGRHVAQEEARAAVQSTLSTLEQLLAALPQRLEMRLAAHEEDMVALCFEAVARFLGQEAAAQNGLRQMLKKALVEFGSRRLVEIRLHPGDVQCLAGDPVVEAWLREREGGESIQIVADPAIELGGIVLRSLSGRLDARLEHQVEALRTALLAARAARAAAQTARPSGMPAGVGA